jgi:hypothetical protein
MKPERRRDGLVVKELEGEVLVYDLQGHQAHCLNPSAAHVFKRCDGTATVPAITRSLRKELGATIDEGWVWLALDRLGKAGLLQERMSPPAERPGLSRRELVKRAGLGLAVLLPVVTSIVAPTPVEAAATCVQNCASPNKPFGTPCSSTAPSNCLCTCDGAGTCVGGC